MKNVCWRLNILCALVLLLCPSVVYAGASKATVRTFGEIISSDRERSTVTVRDIDMNVQKTFNLGRCDFAGLKSGIKVEIRSQVGSVWADSITIMSSIK